MAAVSLVAQVAEAVVSPVAQVAGEAVSPVARAVVAATPVVGALDAGRSDPQKLNQMPTIS